MNDSSCPVDGEFERNGGQAIRPIYLTEIGISGASGFSYPTEGMAAHDNGLSCASNEAVGQDDCLSYPDKEGTRQTNGLSFHTDEGAIGGKASPLALVADEQASILTFPERGTAQTNELTPIAEEGTGQFNEMSSSAEEGALRANGLSALCATGHTTGEGADKTNGHANGLSHPTLRGEEQFNGPRQFNEAGTGQNNWRSQLCNGIDAESIRLSHPTEESAKQAEQLSSQENEDGTSSGIQDTGVTHATQSPVIYGNQAIRLNASVQETGQPNSHGLLSCYQQISDNQLINAVSSMATTERDQATVHQCSMEEYRLWSQLLTRSKPQKATRCKGNVTSTYFIFEISEINQHRQFATPILSHAVFTDTYEWKVGIRLYPNGVDSGWGSHVAVFVHLMNGEYDDLLDWPFPGIITLSVLDQSGARNHISRVLQTKPNLLAFQKPDDAICRTGCGFVKFAPIEVFFRPQYVKNDKMFLKIEFSA